MRSTRPALALGLALSAGLLALPAAAAPSPPPPVPEPLATLLLCPADDPGTVVALGSGAGYDRTVTTTGKNKKTVTTVSGTFTTAFGLEGPSCAGATYTITLRSRDGSTLGWTAGSASGAPVQTVSADGSTVETRWSGDDATTSFSLDGTTSGYAGACVLSTLSIHAPDGSRRFLRTLELCDDNAGSTSYR